MARPLIRLAILSDVLRECPVLGEHRMAAARPFVPRLRNCLIHLTTLIQPNLISGGKGPRNFRGGLGLRGGSGGSQCTKSSPEPGSSPIFPRLGAPPHAPASLPTRDPFQREPEEEADPSAGANPVSVIAGVDVGNATTEVVLVSGGTILAAGRVPTRGRKGSPDSLRGAAALVRRVERQAGCTVSEARIAPLRAVDTSVVTVPDAVPPRGRLRVLAAGVPTPGGAGACAGPPLLLPAAKQPPGEAPLVAVVPPGLPYDEAAARLRALLEAGTQIGAVLVAGDEGVLVANRLPASLPVIDQVDAGAAASCELLAVEVRPPGHAMNLLTDPVALGARLRLSDDEAADAAVLGRALSDYSNAVDLILDSRAQGPA